MLFVFLRHLHQMTAQMPGQQPPDHKHRTHRANHASVGYPAASKDNLSKKIHPVGNSILHILWKSQYDSYCYIISRYSTAIGQHQIMCRAIQTTVLTLIIIDQSVVSLLTDHSQMFLTNQICYLKCCKIKLKYMAISARWSRKKVKYSFCHFQSLPIATCMLCVDMNDTKM